MALAAQGKPVLPADCPHFNLSHSDDLALLAVSASGPVGIDLEQIRPDLEWMPLARRYFHLDEWQALTGLPPNQQREAFFAVWVRKEAWLKALGVGLGYPTTAFAVTVPPAPPALTAAATDSASPTQWRFFDLPVGSGFKGTLVFPATPPVRGIDLLQFSEDSQNTPPIP